MARQRQKDLFSAREIAKIARVTKKVVAAKPLSPEYRNLVASASDLKDRVGHIGEAWRATLSGAKFLKSDPDRYVKEIIRLAEVLRKTGFPNLTHDLYVRAISNLDSLAANAGVRLPKTSLMVNLAISFFERGLYAEGLAWLHASVTEAGTWGTASNRTYAIRKGGLLDQWLATVLPKIPANVIGAVWTRLGVTIRITAFSGFVRWLLGQGEIQVIGGLLDFDRAGTSSDLHADSLRFLSLRSLTGQFEVICKKIGAAHNDSAVATLYSTPEALTLASIMYFSHFPKKANGKADTSSPASIHGLLCNSIAPTNDLVTAIGVGMSLHPKDFGAFWTALATTPLSTIPEVDSLAKRLLVTYRVRNITSHSFAPQLPGLVGNYETIREWVLESILYIVFWTRATGQAPYNF